MPFKTHRLVPTREKEIEVLLEIPLQQYAYAVTATAPGLHPPLETITEDPRSFGIVQISNNLKEAEKEVKLYSEVPKKYKKARDVKQCISRFDPAFRPLSCTPPYSLGTSLSGVGVVQACRLEALRSFSLFRLQPERKRRLKIQNRKIFIHPCVIKA